MRILIGFILFILGSFWLSVIISIGIVSGLKHWEKLKNDRLE
jgi:hypothetical protein